MIETLQSAEPRDKRSREYKTWKELINERFLKYNQIAGQKMFQLL